MQHWEEVLDSDDTEGGWVTVGGEGEAGREEETMEMSSDIEEEIGESNDVMEEEIGESNDVVEEDLNDCAAVVCKMPGYAHPNKELKWVCCKVCNGWIHFPCLRLSGKDIKELDKSYTQYVCERCGGERVEVENYSRLSPKQKSEKKRLARLRERIRTGGKARVCVD